MLVHQQLANSFQHHFLVAA